MAKKKKARGKEEFLLSACTRREESTVWSTVKVHVEKEGRPIELKEFWE